MWNKWRKFKGGMTKVMLLALTIIMVCPNPVYARDINGYEIKFTQSKLAPNSIFKLIEKYSENEYLSRQDMFRIEVLDGIFTDPQTRAYILKERRFPAIPKETAVLLNGFFEVKNMRSFSVNLICFDIVIGYNRAEIYFFKDLEKIEIDPSAGIKNKNDLEAAKKRGYWIKVTDHGIKKRELSLAHKGTADDPLKVVLIMPRSPFQRTKPTRLPVGLMSMASCLRDKSFLFKLSENMPYRRYYEEADIPEIQAYIIDMQAEESDFDLAKRLSEIDPDIVAVSAVTPLFDSAIKAGEIAEQAVPKAVRILGGAHISAIAQQHDGGIEEFFRNSKYQAAILREGEELLGEFILKLFKRMDVRDSENLFVRGENGGHKLKVYAPSANRGRRRISLEEYPMPALSADLLNLNGYEKLTNIEGKDRGVAASIFTSRGCPYLCRFCASYSIFGRETELLSAERVFQEMKFYYDKGFRAFYVVDDNFCFKKQRILDLARLITESGMIDIEYSIMAKAESIDADVAKALKRSGCIIVAMGVESGDQQLLSEEVLKHAKLIRVAKARQALKQAGIYVKYFFMVGLPKQDWVSIEKTASFILNNMPDAVNISVAVPYPGSEYSRSGGIKINDGVTMDQFMHEPEPQLKDKAVLDVVTHTDVMTSEEIAYARDLLMLLFKERNNPNTTGEILEEIRSMCQKNAKSTGISEKAVCLRADTGNILRTKSAFIGRRLERRWIHAVKTQDIAYDPRIKEEVELGGMSACYMEGRLQRTGAESGGISHSFSDGHKGDGCALCEERKRNRSGSLPVIIDGRRYEIIFNHYPAGECHFLLMKESGTEQELSQYVQGADEIKDMLIFKKHLPPEYLMFFNCLPGANGTDGAATVNHWHAHIMKSARGLFHSEFKSLPQFENINNKTSGIRIGTLEGEGTDCRVFEGTDAGLLSVYSSLYLEYLNGQRISYNLVVAKLDNGTLRVAVVPRKRGAPNTQISGVLSTQRYGPSELNGHFVVSERNVFDAVKSGKPQEVKKLLKQQLKEVGFSEEELNCFDNEFLRKESESRSMAGEGGCLGRFDEEGIVASSV